MNINVQIKSTSTDDPVLGGVLNSSACAWHHTSHVLPDACSQPKESMCNAEDGGGWRTIPELPRIQEQGWHLPESFQWVHARDHLT